MNSIAIFDVGKTNKKLFLFDEQYKIVEERTCLLSETVDESGEACEDLDQLNGWVMDSLRRLNELNQGGDHKIRAINFSAYGASLVHIGEGGAPVAPLYNYLKPYPAGLKAKFYSKYGGEVTFSMLTASPVLGSLNSGMQLYRIKEEQPELFDRIQHSLHLPQYLSWLITGIPCSDITSIGCHTNLWNFSQHHYHEWVYREGIMDKLLPILPSDGSVPLDISRLRGLRHASPSPRIPPGAFPACVAGVGLHDSSAALIPYLENFREPFVLISTGTWCISMNPFDDAPLTVQELQNDCLCYLSYKGRPVKSARLFAGYEHGQRVSRLAEYFHKAPDYYTTMAFNPGRVSSLGSECQARELSGFDNYEDAYHSLLMEIIERQVASTQLVMQGSDIKRIFVDGGFGSNTIYMHLLAAAFPQIEVYAATIPQASALGAALAIHRHWNKGPLPSDIIELKKY